MDSNEYEYELTPITAGLAGRLWGWWKNYTSAERRANAAEQLRDRFGRFAEMGRDHKFKFRDKGGATRNGTGIYVGPAARKGYGRFYVKDDPVLGTGVVEVSNKNFREVLTSLSEDYLRSRGISLGQDTKGNIVGARKDSDIPNIDDLNLKPATDEDIEAATSKVEDMPDLEEVIKGAESGSIRYGDLKPGVIVRDEAGNRLGIVTQVDFVNGKVVPLIRWQDGERTPGVESDPEDMLTVWVPAEDADSAEGNKEKASVKARLSPSLMQFGDKKTVTVADLKKGDSVVIGGETLKVKSKKDLEDGTFRIEFANEDGEVVEDLISEPTDTFDLPTPEEKEPAKGKGKKPATPPRKSVGYFFEDVDNLGKLKILAKFGDVLVLPDGQGGTFEAYYISHTKGTDEKGRDGYKVILERASDHEEIRAFIPRGYKTEQLVGPNGKTRVNRAKDVVAKKPTKSESTEEKGKKPAPTAGQPSADENAASPAQLESINRRINEGRYPGIVSEATAKSINDRLPTLTKSKAGPLIRDLDAAELKWRMDNGWSVDELIAEKFSKKDGTVTLPSQQLSDQYASYKPYKDENGDPIPGVEQPAETDKKPVAVVTDHPLPTSGELGATGIIKGKVRYEIKQDGSIHIFNDNSQKGDTTFPYIPIIRSVGYQRDGLGTSVLDQIKENGKFAAWKIIPSIGQASTELLSIEEFRKEILQRLFNRINGIEDPNDVSQSVAEIPEGEVDENASDEIQGTPGETGSLGNGVGFTISANGTVVIYGDVEFGSENSKLITSVLGSDRDGYEVMYDRDGDENFEVQINPTDRSVPKTQHTKNFLNALKKALSFATEEKPAEEEEEEEKPAEELTPEQLEESAKRFTKKRLALRRWFEWDRKHLVEIGVNEERIQEIQKLVGNKWSIFNKDGTATTEADIAEAYDEIATALIKAKLKYLDNTIYFSDIIPEALIPEIDKHNLEAIVRQAKKRKEDDAKREADKKAKQDQIAREVDELSTAGPHEIKHLEEVVPGTFIEVVEKNKPTVWKKVKTVSEIVYTSLDNVPYSYIDIIFEDGTKKRLTSDTRVFSEGVWRITNISQTNPETGEMEPRPVQEPEAEQPAAEPEPEAEAEEDKPESSTESTLKDNDRIATAVDLVMNSLPKEVRDNFLNLFSKYKATPPKSEEEVIQDREIFLEYFEIILTEVAKLLEERHKSQSLSGNENADSILFKSLGDLYNYLTDRFTWFMYDLTDLEELVDEDRDLEILSSFEESALEILKSNDLMGGYLREVDGEEEEEELDSIEQAQSIMDSLSGLRFPANFIPAERTRRDDNQAKDMAKKASNSERNKAWDDARKNLLALIDKETDPAKLKTLVGMFIAVEKEKNKWSLLLDASLGQISFQELTREGMDELFAKHLEKDASIFEAANRSPELISAMRNEARRIYAELGKTEDAEPETEAEPEAEPTLDEIKQREIEELKTAGPHKLKYLEEIVPGTFIEVYREAARTWKKVKSVSDIKLQMGDTAKEESYFVDVVFEDGTTGRIYESIVPPTISQVNPQTGEFESETEEQDDEEEDTELTPDRELETVTASDLVAGDLMWDPLRGFSRVTADPTQSKNNPNNVSVTHQKPGESEARKSEFRKNASISIAKRDKPVKPKPQPAPQPETKPEPKPEDKPKPKPEDKPKPKPTPEPKKTSKVTNVYFIDVKGKVRYVNLEVWSNPKDRETLIEKYRAIEVDRRARYDKNVAEGLTKEPYEPMYFFEDGFEHSSEAATKKQLESIIRRVSIPGLLSDKEKEDLVKKLPTMSKKAIFDLIGKLDNLELQWRMDNGYPIDDLIQKRLPVGFDTNKIRNYVPTKSMSDMAAGEVPPEEPPVSAMQFMDAKTASSDLGIILNPATMDAGERLPTPGAFTGALSEAVQGKNWAEVLDYLKNLETPIYYFDTETTGISDYDGDNQTNTGLQVGIVKVVKGEVAERFNIYLNPEVPLGKWSSENLKRDTVTPQGEVIGSELVTDNWLATQMDTAEAVRQMIDFMGNNPLIGGQNVPFDLEVLQRMLDKAGVTDFKVAGTVDSKDLVDVLVPKYNADTGVDGPKKWNEKKGQYDSTTSLGYVAQFLGFDTTKWHSADADAEDAFRLVMRSLEIALDNPTKNLDALDAKSLLKNYRERMAKFLASVSPDLPATPKQLGEEPKGFRDYLTDAGLTIQEQNRVLAPIKRMTRGQAAAYISDVIKEHKKQGQQTLPLKLNLQQFIDSGKDASDLVLPTGAVLSRVDGLERRKLIRAGDTGKLVVDREYAEQVAFGAALGEPEEALKILTDPDSPRNARKIREAKAIAAAKIARKPRNMVTLSVGDNNFIVYDSLDGVAVSPEKIENLAQLMDEVRKIAPIGNRKLRVSLVTEEQMDLLNKNRPGDADRPAAFFMPDTNYMHILLRKEDFYRRISDDRMTETDDQGLTLHSNGNIPISVRSFLHEYGHAYHYIMVKTNPIFENEEYSPLAIKFREQFDDSYITNYGEKSHHEKFAELFFDYAYSKLTNRAPANPAFMDFIDSIVADKSNKPVGNASLLTSIILQRGLPSKLGFEASGASIRNVNVEGITEITGKNLTELERSMEGHSGGNWLAGTDADSGLIPPLKDANGKFNEAYFKDRWLPRVVIDPAKRGALTPEELKVYKKTFTEQVKKALNDSSTYRVFQINGTNQFIRVKDALADPEKISDVVRNVQMMSKLNNLSNIPVYYTIFPSGTFSYEVYMSDYLAGGVTNENAGDYGIFIGINTDVNFNNKGKFMSPEVEGKNASIGGPNAKDRFNRVVIHEYGHGIAAVYMGDDSSPLYQEFENKFGNKPMSTYGAENARENFAEYFYALYMWVTVKGEIPPDLREFADFFNKNIVGKNPINRQPRELINLAEMGGSSIEPNFPPIKKDADPMSEFSGRRRFYEKGLTPVGTKLDDADAAFISELYSSTLDAEKNYLTLKDAPSVPEKLKNLAKIQFIAQVGALKAAYDSLVFSGNDKYDLAKQFSGENLSLMSFSEGWKDDEQGYSVIWDKYEDLPKTYTAPVDKEVFTAEERDALNRHEYNAVTNSKFPPTDRRLLDKAEAISRGLASAFKKPEATLNRNMYLYYGMAGWHSTNEQLDMLVDVKPGDEITLPSYTSASMSPDAAYNDYGPGAASEIAPQDAVFLIIRAPKGSSAIVTPEGIGSDLEVLINAGAKLRILEAMKWPRLDSYGFGIPNAFSTYIEADLVSTEEAEDRGFETPDGITRDANFEQDLDYLTTAFAQSFNRGLVTYTNKDGGLGSSNSVVGYVTPAALANMPGNTDLDKDNVEKMVRSMEQGVIPSHPVVISYNPETKAAFVLDGNHRVAAALKANVPFLPTMVVTSDVNNPESKKLDKGWAIIPFGIDETGTSERWPDSFHPYFIFNDADMLTPARNNDKPMLMQFGQYEPAVWSSKVPVDLAPKNLVPERGPSEADSQYEIEQLHPGSYVRNKKTGKIGVVYGVSEVPDPVDGSKIISGLIVKYLEGSEESRQSVFYTDESFDEKGIRRMATGETSVDGYSDIRFHTLRITNPANLEPVTDDFITPGTNGILLDETMFGAIKDTEKRGHIVGFPDRGVVEVAVSNGDGSFSFEKIPVSKFLPVQNQRTSSSPGTVATHSDDMRPTLDDVDWIRTKLENLYNWGFLSEKVYKAMKESIRGRFLTKSGAAELRNALNKADSLRKNKKSGGRVKKISTLRKRIDDPVDPQQSKVAPTQIPQNVGDMTIDEFMKFLQGKPSNQQSFMQFDDGEENTSPTIETAVEDNPPTVSDIRIIQDIIQEAGVVPEMRAKQIWEMLPLLDADEISRLKAKTLGNLLDKRIRLGQPIAGIEIPENYDKSKLDGYTPTVNLDGSPIQTSATSRDPGALPDPREFELSNEQKSIYNHVESTNTPVMISGFAGTGKSFLLKFLAMFSSKRLAVVAPTGAAADNVQGATIHSFFGFRTGIIYGNIESSRLIDKTGKKKAEVEARLKALQMLIVDEVSMVSADLLDAMDRVLRRVHKKPFVAFGGVQLVMFGDVHQLPPVVPEGSPLDKYMQETFRSKHFFDSRAWVDNPLEVFYLTKIFRQNQNEPEFKKALNNIRVGMQTPDDMNLINGVKSDVPSSVKDLVFLVPRKEQAKEINNKEMNKLGNVKSMTYTGEFNGLGRESFGSDADLPVTENLTLKVGTRVMFMMNDTDKTVGKDLVDAESGQGVGKERRWVNGTVGTVVDLLENSVKVDINGVVHEVKAATWERVGYNVKQKADPVSNQITNKLVSFTEATYKQIPLVPAWAITIHKSQGKTLDNVKVDLGPKGAFAEGQVYTALSRVRSLAGLYLEVPVTSDDIKVDENSLRFTKLTNGLGTTNNSQPSLMMFGGEPFDPADPNLDLDKELNYDFTSGPYGIPLLDYQEEMMQIYADMIAEAEKQFGSNSNRVKELKSTRREHYGSYFARPEKREDSIMDKATESLKIDLEGSITEEYDNPNYRDFKTTTTASYKDRYGRQYRFEGVVSLQELYYGEPGKIQTYIEVKAYDLAGNTDEAVASMSTEWGDIQDGPLLDNQVYIANIETKEEYQRRYLATGLLAFANQLTDKKILHSDKLTKKGYAFMSSVEMDEDRKTIDYPSLAESQDERDKIMVIDITKLRETKSSAEITDLLQRLNADQISYKLK
jgi:DNA polymerase III epsilon subunit-like protein/outer membrane biosynthesis protein TonB